MTATIVPASSSTATLPSSRSRGRLAARPVWLVGAAAGVLAAVATTVVAVVAEALDVPMAAGSSADAIEDIPLYGYGQATLIFTAVGVVLAIALARWAKRPARTFAVTTVVLTVVSFAGPLTTHATTATKLVLDVAHVVAAAIVIPAITWRLSQRPGRSAG